MSMTFVKPITRETRDMIEMFIGKPVADDGKTLLFDVSPFNVYPRNMAKIINSAGEQPTIKEYATGDIVALGDGTRYQESEEGWHLLATRSRRKS